MYFKFDLSFYIFAIILFNKLTVKVERKINSDKYCETEGVV
jgi:hypothetical protein